MASDVLAARGQSEIVLCALRVAMSSAASANYYCANIFYIDERVEIFRAGEIGKMDDIVSHLRDFASHFFSRSQVQLDRFACVALKDAGYGRSRLQSSFFLGGQTGTGDCCNNHCNKD
jgi:20S proteasome alpha/beta subunit